MPTNVKLSDVEVGTIPPLRRRKSRNGIVTTTIGQPVPEDEWVYLDRCDVFTARFDPLRFAVVEPGRGEYDGGRWTAKSAA